MASEPAFPQPGAGQSPIEGISAVTLATHDMARAMPVYQALGFAVSHGGVGPPSAACTQGPAS